MDGLTYFIFKDSIVLSFNPDSGEIISEIIPKDDSRYEIISKMIRSGEQGEVLEILKKGLIKDSLKMK